MKVPITRARRQFLQLLGTVQRGRRVTVTRRGRPALSLEPDGSIMIREQPADEDVRVAARAILTGMRQRAGAETAREALAAIRKRLG